MLLGASVHAQPELDYGHDRDYGTRMAGIAFLMVVGFLALPVVVFLWTASWVILGRESPRPRDADRERNRPTLAR
jgi:hypothetical protein